MTTFLFKCQATETLNGTAYFQVEAETEAEARTLLVEDASEYFTDFSETGGDTTWDAKAAEDFEEI